MTTALTETRTQPVEYEPTNPKIKEGLQMLFEAHQEQDEWLRRRLVDSAMRNLEFFESLQRMQTYERR